MGTRHGHVRQIAVAVPVPFLDALTYSVPDHLDLPPIGARVRVPVGSRTLTGCVVAHDESADAPAGEVKPIVEAVDREPFLPPQVVELCRWVAEYYLAGVGDAIAAAMPPGARQKAASFRTRRVAALTAHGLGSDPISRPDSGGQAPLVDPAQDVESSREGGLTLKQRQAMEVLAGAPMGLPLSELRDRGISADVLARLAARGLVTLRSETDERDPFERAALPSVEPDQSRALTSEQVTALDQLLALADTGAFHVALLHGVTGSGKTEIYLKLAERARRAGRQMLLMVPEIALTPSVSSLFRTAFGDRVAIQHSALSDGERHDQ